MNLNAEFQPAEGPRPLIVWTLQRTGGTNLAVRLFERLGHPHPPHEPFNPGRVYEFIAERWRSDHDRSALDAAVAEIVARREQIKHCVEMVPWELTESLVRKSVGAAYSHLFLYRRQPLDRLLSLHFAKRSGIWGPTGSGNPAVDEAVFAEPLPVADLVHHEARCADLLTRTWESLVGQGGAPLALAYEDVYLSESHAARDAAMLPVIAALGLSQGWKADRDFIEDIVGRGEQGTRDKYASFDGVDRLERALTSVRGFAPACQSREIKVTAAGGRPSWILHAALDMAPRSTLLGAPVSIGGVVVLGASAPQPCRLAYVTGTAESEIEWGIASPTMARKHPAAINGARSRYAVSVPGLRDGELAEIHLVGPSGARMPLFRLRIQDKPQRPG